MNPDRIFSVVVSDYRTGSTLLYNIIKEIVEILYPKTHKVYHGDNIQDITRWYLNDKNTIYLLKSHLDLRDLPFEEDLKIFYITRNHLDKVSSSLLRGYSTGHNSLKDLPKDGIDIDDPNFWEQQLLNMEETQEQLKHYQERSNSIVIQYEEMYYNMKKIIQDIANHLSLCIDNIIIERIEKKLSLNNIKNLTKGIEHSDWIEDYDTQWRGNHISILNGEPNQWMLALPEHAIISFLRKYKEINL